MSDFPLQKSAVILAGILLAITIAAVPLQAQGPHIFFTDIQSGPNSGGENGNGAYVTIYGSGFGSSQGSSTVSLNGSGNALSVVSWGSPWRWYQKIVVQVLSSATSGNLVVTVGGQPSNGVAFTVRAGNIYCVSTTGNDSASGKFPNCWKSLTQAHGLAAGDILYALNGVTLTGTDNYNATLWLGDSGSGTAAAPKALLAYPGATVTVGSTTSGSYGVRGSSYHTANNYWVVGGLTIRSGAEGIELSPAVDHWWIVGNDISCPNGSGQAACVHSDTTTNLWVHGNYIHNVGDTAGSIDKYYHGLYLTTNTNHVWVGWNEVAPNPNNVTTSGGCRAIQFYSTGGADQFDLHVHDNLIHDAICDGINFSTVNTNNGPVEAYNNVIYHVGTGPDPADGASNYSCITLGSSSSPTQSADIYNNTMYDCGSRKNSDSGGIDFYIPARYRNNVMYLVSGESYSAANSTPSCSSLSGSNNLWFGGSSPSWFSCLSSNAVADPLFVNSSARDFHLQAGSPAIDKGLTISSLLTDIGGTGRPQGSAYDIGAYEYGSAAIARPNPPTNLSVTVK